MGEPAWAVAKLFPAQGEWTEEDYLALSDEHPRVELSDGCVEVLPAPTDRHQAVLTALLLVLIEHARRVGGVARPAGLRVRLRDNRFREPDVVFLGASRLHLRGEEFWTGADLVVEVLSGGVDDRTRDLVTKRREYAEASIPEYWVADPENGTILVLVLRDGRYEEVGAFGRGASFRSPTQEGVVVDVGAVVDAP